MQIRFDNGIEVFTFEHPIVAGALCLFASHNGRTFNHGSTTVRPHELVERLHRIEIGREIGDLTPPPVPTRSRY